MKKIKGNNAVEEPFCDKMGWVGQRDTSSSQNTGVKKFFVTFHWVRLPGLLKQGGTQRAATYLGLSVLPSN